VVPIAQLNHSLERCSAEAGVACPLALQRLNLLEAASQPDVGVDGLTPLQKLLVDLVYDVRPCAGAWGRHRQPRGFVQEDG